MNNAMSLSQTYMNLFGNVIAHHMGKISSILLVFLFLILFLTKTRYWVSKSTNHKWPSRSILFISMLLVIAPLACLLPGALIGMRGITLNLESPNLTASAIKLGLYNIHSAHKVKSILSSKEAASVDCVIAISRHDTIEKQSKCGNDWACLENLPTMTQEAIIERIKESQTTDIPDLTKFCKDVDVSYLMSSK